ncbi:hypothetical protein V6N11_018868 [Hibiscus sabdariffa]|uniref:Uncharacterized protein n=1 Tax=Hibiscus sabdariffa TaxID=183260 RepID=A0ABR2N6E2_9ROSI
MNDTSDASAAEPTTPTVTVAVDTAKCTINATLPSALAVKEGTKDDAVSVPTVFHSIESKRAKAKHP